MPNRRNRYHTPGSIGVCTALLALAGSLAFAQADRDNQEISHYTLTESGLTKFAAATQNLEKAGESSPAKCDDDGESPASLDKFVAQIDATPKAKAAIQSAGMSTREYVVFSMSLLQTGLAAWGVEQGAKLPPNVSKANVDFYKAHKSALEKMGTGKKDKCKDSGDDRDQEDDRDSE